MNNLYLAFTVVFPLFCMMSLGYLLKVIHIFNDDFLKQLNTLGFKVFLPLVLFSNIYKSDFKALFSPKLILFALLSVTAAFLLLLFLVPRFEKENLNRGVIIQGVFRSNFILFGIPVTISLYGSENTSVTAILLAFVIPLFNLLATIVLEIYGNKKSSAATVAKGVIKNPLILGALCAFFFVLTGIKLPDIMVSTISEIGGVATPLALIVLGGSFQFKSLESNIRPLAFSVFGKLVLMPLVFLPIGIWMGFRDVELTALLALFASPTAVSSYTMAQSMNANDELAGQIVVVDSICSVLTIFIWITVLKQMQLI